jgi:hypothetical protein
MPKNNVNLMGGEVMFPQMDSFQKFGKEHMEASTKVMTACAESMRTIASEGVDLCKKAFENNAATLEKLSSARSVDAVVDIHTRAMKQAYEDGVSCTARIGELWGDVVKEACKPYESMYSAMAGFAQSLTPKR